MKLFFFFKNPLTLKRKNVIKAFYMNTKFFDFFLKDRCLTKQKT